MARPSDRQIELLTKIFKQSATEEDIQEYLKLLVTDNVLGMEKLPKLMFLPHDKMESALGLSTEDGELDISSLLIDNIKSNPQDIVFGINTIGHELRHFNQRKADRDLITQEGRAQQEKIDAAVTTYAESSGEFLCSLKTLESAYSQKLLREYFKQHKEEPLAAWYLEIPPQERSNLYSNLEESRYLGGAHEIDARAAALVYQTIILNGYLNDERVQQNKELHSWLAKIKKKEGELYENDYADDLELSEYYNEFADAAQKISRKFLVDIAQNVAKFQTEDSDKRKTFEALLCVASKYYIQSIKKDDLPQVFVWAMQNINEQNTNGSATPPRVLACALASSIFFDERLDKEEQTKFKKELFDVYFEHAKFAKNQLKANTGIHKFDRFDTFMLHIAAFSSDQIMFDLLHKLDSNQRYDEVCKMVDFKKLYLAEIDIDETIPEDYLYNIMNLLAAKCEMLFSIRKEFTNQKFTHSQDAQRLKWLAQEIKNAKDELLFLYKNQEDKKEPKTDKEVDEYYDYIKDVTHFDLNYFDLVEREIAQTIKSHPARFEEKERE